MFLLGLDAFEWNADGVERELDKAGRLSCSGKLE